MSLVNCLRKTGLSEEEVRIFDDLVAGHQADGMSPKDAQRAAAESRLSELDADQTEIQAKIDEQMPEVGGVLDRERVDRAEELGLAVTENVLGKQYSNENARISVMENAKFAPRDNSITDFVVDEAERGKGLGREILNDVLSLYNINTISAAASSASSVALFYEKGFRPISKPDSTLKESLKKMEEASSVTMVTPVEQPAITEGIQLEEITDAQEQQKLFEEFAALRPEGLRAEEKPYRTISGREIDDTWRTATRILRNGNPAILHRGASRKLTATDFEQESLGAATGHPTSGLGVYLSSDQGVASGYGPVVESVHVDIRNPKIYTVDDSPEFDSVEDAYAHREALRKEGYDGIIFDYREIDGPVNFVAFDADQVIHPPEADDVKTFYQPAYHGTPHKFDKFSLDSMGSGEGAQAYGWGMYFASDKTVAEWYRDTLSTGIMTKLPDGTMRVPEEYFFKGKPILDLYDQATNKGEYYKAEIFERILLHSTPNQIKTYFSKDEYGSDSDAYKFAQSIKEADIAGKVDDEFVDLEFDLGNIYQVELPENETLLDWDKELKDQSELVIAALKTNENIDKAWDKLQSWTGGAFYKRWIGEHSASETSELLGSVGINGLRYLDGTSRGTDGDKYNYVIWDENVVTIESINDELIKAREFNQKQKPSSLLNSDGTEISQSDIDYIMDENRWLDVGLKIGKKTKIYRGSSTGDAYTPNTESGMSTQGNGLYTTTDKKQAKEYGEVFELDHYSLPTNPLRFTDEMNYGNWLAVVRERLGFKRVSEFEEANGGAIDEWVRRIDDSIDGIQIGTGKGAYFVKFIERADVYEQPTRASIQFTKDNESIIRLTKASDLSSFLHESGHLFLEMESRFADKFGQTKDQEALLDWLGVKSFDDIKVEHHEKFAETFEVYLREGKAPSLKLREAFSAFARWLTVIYRKLTDPRLINADLTPEIRQYMDRMLATEVEIEQAMANPAYDQLFRSKEQAGMTDDQWKKYQEQAAKAKNTATIDLEQKVIDELRKRKTKEWKEEREPLIEEEAERLAKMPVYEVMNLALENPMDRKLVKEELGLTPMTIAERYAAGSKIDLEKDSLLVAAAKKGGLNMQVWEREFVDPENLKDKGFNNQVFGRPIFRKKEGMSADDLAEMANELGYAIDITANEVLELVDREISGDPVYTPAGIERNAEIDWMEREDIAPEKKTTTKLQRLLTRITSTEGENPQAYAELFGYDSVIEMIEDMVAAKSIKKAAYDNAEARMVEKYGDMINDGRIELEARESVHNEEQAKLLLHEIRALSRGKSPINREYLKTEAKTLIESMTFKEIKPSKFYRAEIKAAQNAVEASSDKDKLAFKTQQIANHYLYKEAVKTKETMTKHRKQVRGYETRNYKVNSVAPSYVQNIKMLAKSYNMKKGEAGKNIDVERIVSWMITQMDDPNNYVDLTIIDPAIIKMIVARQDGLPVDYVLPEFNDLTASELKGLVDQLKHMRFVGGKLSDEVKNDILVDRRNAAESIDKSAKKIIGPRHEVTKSARIKDAFNEFGYSHRRIGGIFETLDGFEEGGPMAAEYEKITDSSNKELELTDLMAQEMNSAFKGVMNEINRFKKVTITKDDGAKFTLSQRARFVLGLNWGNTGNRDALLDGLNTKFPDTYTANDIVTMLSTMSNQELESLNKIWSAKELLWPEMSKTEVKRKGVAPLKVEALPFTINNVKLTGGHYRLHYLKDPADTARTEITVDRGANKSIKIGTASSMNERVGAGGRQVDLELGHLFQDISEEIHYIAYAELSDHLNSIFKGVDNEIVTSIIKGYGEPYYDNLANTLSTLTQPDEPAQGLWKGLKFVRSNLTYGFLAGSIRNIVQQPIAVTNAISQLGGLNVIKGSLEFYRNPVGNWDKISEASAFMRNRTALVNREAREQLLKVDAMHPALGAMKNLAFLPQTFMDSLIAYPTWMGALSKYKKEHPNASEKKAIYYADEMVAKTIGSGLSKDLGSILNKGEAEKQITFMGTFFNLTWNLHVENAQLLKRGKINPIEYARRLGWMAIAPALLSVWLLDDLPEDDEKKITHMMKEIGYYNMSSLFLVRDLASTMDGFSPSIPGLKFADGIVRVGKEMRGLMTGDEEFDANTVASIIRGLQPLMPLPMSGQVARSLEGFSDPKQEFWGALVEGKERNK